MDSYLVQFENNPDEEVWAKYYVNLGFHRIGYIGLNPANHGKDAKVYEYDKWVFSPTGGSVIMARETLDEISRFLARLNSKI